MNTRLQNFIAAENLSQAQLADALNVARANISHILSGRNKPGYDFLEKLISAFPYLNITWLITGKGKMYNNKETSDPSPSDILFPVEPTEEIAPQVAVNNEPKIQVSSENNSIDNTNKTAQNQANISRIIVFYDDKSFQEYSPR